jgi:hypothetical protein
MPIIHGLLDRHGAGNSVPAEQVNKRLFSRHYKLNARPSPSKHGRSLLNPAF